MGVLALGCSASWWPPAASRCGTCSCWPRGLGAVVGHRRPGAAGVRLGDGRPRAAGQRGQPQLDDLQRRPAGRPGAGRPAHRRRRRATPPRPSSSTRPASPSPSARSPACAPPSCGPARRSPAPRGQLRAGRGLHLGASRPGAGDGAGLRHRHLRLQLPGDDRADGPASVFGLGAEAFGLLSTFFAVGSLTGALLSTRRSVRPRQRFLVGLRGGVRRCSPSSPG